MKKITNVHFCVIIMFEFWMAITPVDQKAQLCFISPSLKVVDPICSLKMWDWIQNNGM